MRHNRDRILFALRSRMCRLSRLRILDVFHVTGFDNDDVW